MIAKGKAYRATSLNLVFAIGTCICLQITARAQCNAVIQIDEIGPLGLMFRPTATGAFTEATTMFDSVLVRTKFGYLHALLPAVAERSLEPMIRARLMEITLVKDGARQTVDLSERASEKLQEAARCIWLGMQTVRDEETSANGGAAGIASAMPGCDYIEDEYDSFLKVQRLTARAKAIFNMFESAWFDFRLIDGRCYLRCTFTNIFTAPVIGEGDKLLFKLDDGNVIHFESTETAIGELLVSGSTRVWKVTANYAADMDRFRQLKDVPVAGIRVYAAGVYAEYDTSAKTQVRRRLQEAARCAAR